MKYTLHPSHTRHLTLSIHPDGSLVVKAPKHINKEAIERFIAQKSKWIEKKRAYFKAHFEKKNKIKEELYKKYGEIYVKSSNQKQEYKKYKETAEELVQERLEYFNATYKFKYNKVSIKNQKTRWGSCSKRGNINFNYKLALIPKRMADYIIIHELCHLKELNHGANFWKLVSVAMPEYKEVRGDLRKMGVVLG